MGATRKTVSVIIPVFNGQDTLAAALDSALAQVFDGHLELVVVDDGSTDSTSIVVERYRDRVNVVDGQGRGTAAARNAGVRASSGEYVAFLDADDIWLPHKLAATLSKFDGDDSLALVYSDATKFDGAGQSLGPCNPPEQDRAPTMSDLLSVEWNVLPSTTVMRRATFDAIGGFCEDFGRHPKWEDTWFMILAREQGAFAYIAEPLVLYRVVASFSADSQRRASGARGSSWALRKRIARYEKCSALFRRLAHDRFGDRAAPLIDSILNSTVNMLVGVGLTAMQRGNRSAARYAYSRAIEYQRINPKVWARIGWTYVPDHAAHAISTRLPLRLQRALAGSVQG